MCRSGTTACLDRNSPSFVKASIFEVHSGARRSRPASLNPFLASPPLAPAWGRPPQRERTLFPGRVVPPRNKPLTSLSRAPIRRRLRTRYFRPLRARPARVAGLQIPEGKGVGAAAMTSGIQGKDWRMRKALRSVSFLPVSRDASDAAGRPTLYLRFQK